MGAHTSRSGGDSGSGPGGLRLRLLGPPVVELAGRRAEFDTRKATAVLALLAVNRSEMSRVVIAGLLWPESDEERARSSLRRTLSVTTAQVGRALKTTRATVSLDADLVWCDLWELERAAASSADHAALVTAAGLWRGGFLDGFSLRDCQEFDLWQEQVAEGTRQRLAQVLSGLVALESASGDLAGALEHAKGWLSLDSLNEPAHQAVMRLHAMTDDRAAALRQYRTCLRILDSELGVPPLPETTALYEDIRAGRVLPVTRRPTVEVPTQPPVATGRQSDGLSPQEPVVEAFFQTWRSAGLKSLGHVVGLRGLSGSGKSRILEEVSARVGRAGGTVISARCYEAERALALGTVTEIIGSVVRRHPDLAAAVGEEGRFALGRLLGGGEESASSGQIRIYLGVAQILAACGGEQPALVTVDDAQWMDDASAQLLGYLMRRPELEPVVMAISWQLESGLRQSLRGAVEDAVASGRGSLLMPRPLTVEDARHILQGRGVGSLDPAELISITDGLPMLVTAYAEAASANPGTAMPGPVPSTVRELLRRRLDRASETTTQVLSAAAVLGRHADPELLRLTSGRSDSEVTDALEEAVRRGLIVENAGEAAGDTDRYAFAYEVMRHVVYETCSAARRRLLHGRAADALAHQFARAESTTPPALIADHLRRAGRMPEAAEWEWRAARRSVALFAHEEALEHARAALDLGHDGVEARLAAAEALIALGRYGEAEAELELAASQEGLSEPGLAAIEQRLAGVHDRLGDWVAASAHLDTALQLARDDPVLHARIQADRALVAYRVGHDQAVRMAEAARREAEAGHAGQPADALALAQALNVSGVLAARGGDFTEAEALLRQSVSAAELLLSSGTPKPGPKVAALNNLARALFDAGRLSEALDVASEALELGLQAGDVHRAAALHSNLADLLNASGRTEDALLHLKEAASLFASVSPAGPEYLRTSPQVWTLVEW